MTSFFYVVSILFHTSVSALQKCMDTSRKKIILAESAATRAPPAALLRRTWKTCLPLPLWAVQRHESHWRRGLASTVDVEDTRRTDLGLLQQLNGQYGAKHWHIWAKQLYSDVHIIWTWLQDIGDSLGDLHMLHWSQCSRGHVVCQNYPLLIPKESQHNLSRRVVCGIFSVLVRRYGAIPCSLSWFPVGGSGPRFHLP